MTLIRVSTVSNNLVAILAMILVPISFWNEIISEWFALLLIFFAGIPHGSFDLRLARYKWQNNLHANPMNSQLRIIIIYSLIGLMMSIVCLLFKTLGFLVFLVISILHFGESECKYLGRYWGYLIGIVSILSPITVHPNESLEYLIFFVPEAQFSLVLPILSKVNILILCLLIARIFWLFRIKNLSSYAPNFDKKFVLEILICILSWIVLPPLAGRHTKQHFSTCLELFSAKKDIPKINFSLKNLFNSSDLIILSIVAMVLVLPLTFIFNFFVISEFFAASIVLIAGLTLPHFIVTHGINSEK
jgi:Brp/Blh family beta-carotene 15,15'-monooxygenase